MKTKVAILYEAGLPTPYSESRPLQIETVELQEPRANEVLIKIKAIGLCHSDLSVINGSRPRPTPMVLGHEAAGKIVQLGESVKDFEIGDHVVCTFIPSCGYCDFCREGRPALCENGSVANNKGEMLEGGNRFNRNQDYLHHHLGVSGFAEYAVVSTNSIVKVDRDIPFEKLAVFGCAVITGVGAVTNTANISMGSTVAVVGMGGIGLNSLLGAKLAGARDIIAIDINDSKLETAKKLGATDVYNSKDESIVQQIKEKYDGGVDYAFETAGVVPAMEVAYQVTKRGGTTVTTGLPDPEHKFAFPQVTLTAEERTIKGSYVGSCVPTRDIPRFIELYKQGRLPIDKLLTDTISLDEINEGFDRLATGDVARLVVKMDE
ncbi:zinc-dependent alcohol dehydrogenase family protein [Oceanobacillus sp. CAU 1775]